MTREVLWHGNRETLSELLGRQSLLWKHPARRTAWRREYPALLAAPESAHLHIHHLRSPSEAEHFLGKPRCLPATAGST